MFRTYKYRLYPNKQTERILLSNLEICRWTYNAILGYRKSEYENNKKTLSNFDTCKLITQWKKNPDYEFLKIPYAQVLQNVSVRVDLAYKSFFRRLKNGEKPGFPRFKGVGNYDSLTYFQGGYSLKTDDYGKVFLWLSKIGNIKVVYHRKVEGEIQNCIIRKSTTGKWYVSFVCEIPDITTPNVNYENSIGIDCGLESFITLSNGQKIESKKFYRKAELKLKFLHKKVSDFKNDSIERIDAKKRLSLAYEKTRNQRENFAHQISRWLVNDYDFIVFEDLNIVEMKEKKKIKLAKSIEDVAWFELIEKCIYKAESAGKLVQLVNPAYTSQTCSGCGNIKKKKLSERWHDCEICGLSIDRDENAAINILRLGIQSLEASV